jgi:hypothetical protein
MVLQHLRMIGITDIIRAQAMHNTGCGQTGNGAGEFVRVLGQCAVSIFMRLKTEIPVRLFCCQKFFNQGGSVSFGSNNRPCPGREHNPKLIWRKIFMKNSF